MIKKSLFVAVLVLFGCVGSGYCACTAEEAQEKARVFIEQAMQLAQKDAQKYQEVAQAMQTQLPELQKLDDLEKLCNFYDEWTAKMQ